MKRCRIMGFWSLGSEGASELVVLRFVVTVLKPSLLEQRRPNKCRCVLDMYIKGAKDRTSFSPLFVFFSSCYTIQSYLPTYPIKLLYHKTLTI